MIKFAWLTVLALVTINFVDCKKYWRKSTNVCFSESQQKQLEEIQLLAQKGGLPQWKSITKYDPELCYEPECLDSAIEIMSATNFTVDPCEPDMWLEFACARRVNGHDNVNQLEKLMKVVEKQTANLLEDKTGIYDHEFLWKEAQTHYLQCKYRSQADDQDVLDIMKYSENYGNWPILTNKDPGPKFNWLEMVADLNRIQKVGYSPYLLKVHVPEFMKEVGPIELNLGRTIIHVSNKDLQSMLTLVQKKMQRKKPVRIDHLAPIVMFMANISSSTVVQEVAQSMTIKQFQNKTNQYLHQMNMHFDVNWLGFFQRVFKGVDSIKVSPSLLIKVSFNQLMRVLSSVYGYQTSKDKKMRWAIANVLQFQLVSTLIQESTDLLEDMNSFKCVELSGDRKETCQARIQEVFGYALGATYIKYYYDNNKTTPAIKRLMYNIKRGYMDVISKTNWMQNSTKEFLMDKIESIKTYFAYPKWIMDEKQLSQFFKGLSLPTEMNSSYPMNYLTMNSWKVAKKRSWSYKYLNLTAWKGFPLYDVEWNHYPAAVQAQYHKAINEARIEAGVIQKPIFEVNRPGFMNFGGLGMVLAHEIGHSFDIVGRLFNKNGESVKEYWDAASLKKYYEWVKQVALQYGSEPFRITDNSAEQVDPWKSINEDIADILAVYISFHSYEIYLDNLEKRGKKEKILPGLKGFSPQKLFYMKYANMWCDNKEIQDKFKDFLSDHSSGRVRASLPLKYSKQFAKAFSCKLPTSSNSL